MKIVRAGREAGRKTGMATAFVAAAGLAAALLTQPAAANAASAATSTVATTAATPPPAIERTVSDAGFAHPGIGLTADNLENMRTQVAAGVDPWASYYAAMTQTPYAATTYKGENQGATDDAPVSDAYDSATMSTRELHDSKGAMTQALEYVVTGDETYRANALHVIRTWSSLDASKFAYFADADIHTGVPLYQLLVAAEIIRSTTPADDDLDGYDLHWTSTDEQRIETNFIKPVLSTFLSSQDHLWNQHLYGEIGSIAAAIFMDDSDLYAQRVEWFTVNSTYKPEIDINGGDVNGALASLVRTISADDPLNATGQAFTQVMEMGRDQAHTEGDIDLLGTIARVIDDQGTKVDPTKGTVSTKADAVTSYGFLDDRILKGADVFAAFMIGDDVPYVDTSGSSGKVSQGYRGRINNSLDELYYQYKYVAGIDIAKDAPHLQELYDHRDGPLYYSGTGIENFWADRGTDFTGAEYWAAFPAQLADEDVTVPAAQDSPELDVDHVGHVIGAGATRGVDSDGTGYVALDPAKGSGQLAVRRAVFPDRSTTALVGIRVRTQATAVLEVAPTSGTDNHVAIQVPNTDGKWRYVSIDIAAAKLPIAPVGSNIVYLRAASGATIDVASVLAQANGTLTPPTFSDGTSLSVAAVAGESFSRTLKVTPTGTGPFTLALQDAPEGASLSDDGVLTWQPTTSDVGAHRAVVVASDGTTDTALPVTITVAKDRAGAIDDLLDGLASSDTYTSISWDKVVRAQQGAQDAEADASSSDFAALLDTLREAAENLQPLDPRLEDGTLDYHAIVTSPQISEPTLALLTDGDNQSTWGDQRVQSVILDFGTGYRVRADSFGFLARDTFANRAQGTNVYGSIDGTTWTLLTEHPNAGDDASIETVPVVEDQRQSRFRFLKLQVDDPGVPTDPAYPGIWTLADFRIDGDRTEAVGALDSVTISAPGSVASRVVPGDSVQLNLKGDADTTGVGVSVLGKAADVTSDGDGSWVAKTKVPDAGKTGVPVTFAVTFTTSDGRQADPVEATTDGSKLYLSTDEDRVDDLLATATTLDPHGNPSSAGATDTAHMLDGDASSQSDTRAVDGVYAITWDFGAGTAVSLTGADLLLRQDGYGISRLADLRFEGSNDLKTWKRLTPAAVQGTLDWQPWAIGDHGSYRYVRLINGNIIGVSELRLFGTKTLDLAGLLASAKALDLSTYSRGSAITFTREAAAVEAASNESGADTQALAQRLLDDQKLLAPAPVAAAPVERAWVIASSKSWDGKSDAAANGWAMFDGNSTTYTDTTTASGWVQMVPDDGSTFTVDTVRFLPRAGFASRATGVQFQGSDDGGTTWTTFATAGTVTSDGWNEIALDDPVTYKAVRVLVPAGNTNLAEVQLVRTIVDITGLELYLDEAGGLKADDWTPESWAVVEDARDAGRGLVADGAEPTQDAVDDASRALADAIGDLEAAVPAGTTTQPPAKGVLSSDSGWTNGLADGNYTVSMDLWWGPNATRIKLYEDGTLVGTRDLIDDSPNVQHVAFPVTGRKNGTYTYTAMLINRNGQTKTAPLTVKVTDASPGKATLAYDAGARSLHMDMWWGTNATAYRLYEDGTLIDSQSLAAATPSAQHAVTDLSDRPSGRHTYQAELENAAGTTSTATVSVTLP